MAILLNEDIQRLYKDRPRKKEIDTGIRHQRRLRFHTETVIFKEQLSPYYREFINWIASENPELLPKDKVERFKQLVTLPLPTIELTESIFSHLKNVFRGQDAFNRYIFDNPELEKDWEEFNNVEFWQSAGFQAMINGIDSAWVVDIPGSQLGDRPEPKDKLIDIEDIIDISVDNKNVCGHIIFRVGDLVYEYDEAFIRVYETKDGKLSLTPVFEMTHGLGYCPARMFWTDRIMSNNFYNKKAPLTNVLGDLDWLLVCHIFKKYMEIANSYPILAAYQQADDFIDSRQESDRGRPAEERKTDGGGLVGPGSILSVRPPLAGESDPMANPLKFINPDVANLTFHVDNIADKRDLIFFSVVGKGNEATKEAVNEKQVMASFESQSAILMNIAYNFKLIQEFAEKCKADIRYGNDQLKDICIDYGTKFFLRSSNDYIEDLRLSKENGSHSSVIGTIMDEIIEAKFRNDRRGMTRAQIIQELDPLSDKTLEEAVQILDKGGITKEQFIIKANLLNFVKRFEREQVPLVDYASARPYSFKIAAIYDEFLKYAKEITGEEDDETEPPDVEEIPEEETPDDETRMEEVE